MAERDLTQGPLGGHLKAMVVPAALGMLFTTLYNVVDTYYAGWISTEAQAGLSVSFSAFMLLMSVGFGLSQGASALIGSALGARSVESARAVACQALVLAGLFGGGLGLLGALQSDSMLRAMGADSSVFAAAHDYLIILFCGLPSFLIAFTANGVLTAQGDTQANRTAQIAAFAANVALNPLLIYGAFGVPGLGFDGIALSTVLIQTGVAIWLVRRALATRAMERARWLDGVPTAPIALDLFKQGAPASMTMMVMMVGGLIIQVHLQPFGAAAVAGFGIAFRVEQLILLPILSISFSLMPMIAQNYGASDYDRVRQATTLALAVALSLAAIGALLLAIGGVAMTRIFTDDQDAIKSSAAYLRMAALMMPAYTAMFIITAFFQGLKRPIWSVAVGVYRQILALMLFPWLFVHVFDFGLAGVWFGLFVAVWSGFVLAGALAIFVGRQTIGEISPDFSAIRS